MDTSDASRATVNLCQISSNRPIVQRQDQLCAGCIWRDRSTSRRNVIIERFAISFYGRRCAAEHSREKFSIFLFFHESTFSEVSRTASTSRRRRNKIGHVVRVTRVCSISILQESEAVVSTHVPRYHSQLGVRADAR